MNCPWCEREMQAGELIGDCRRNIRFHPEGEKLTFGDMLCGTGLLTAAHNKWMDFHLPAHYCRYCKKMVIETEVIR